MQIDSKKVIDVQDTIPHRFLLIVTCICMMLLTACSGAASTPTHNTISSNSGSIITYDIRPQDVLIRTFYGGGKRGTLEMSPDISIYGDGTYILGPGLQMREGRLQVDAVQQLLFTLVDNYGLTSLNRHHFYYISNPNLTVLQLNLNDK